MLENIALIVSIISGLTAITTSLRAVGISREHSHYGLKSGLKTPPGMREYQFGHQASQSRSLRLYLLVTLIWFGLSVIFSIPYIIEKCGIGQEKIVLICFSPLLILLFLLCIIWLYIIRRKTSRY